MERLHPPREADRPFTLRVLQQPQRQNLCFSFLFLFLSRVVVCRRCDFVGRTCRVRGDYIRRARALLRELFASFLSSPTGRERAGREGVPWCIKTLTLRTPTPAELSRAEPSRDG